MQTPSRGVAFAWRCVRWQGEHTARNQRIQSAPTAMLTTSLTALKLLAIFGRCGSAVERLIWCDRLFVIKTTLHFLEYRILRFEEFSYGTTREQNIIALHASRYYKKRFKLMYSSRTRNYILQQFLVLDIIL